MSGGMRRAYPGEAADAAGRRAGRAGRGAASFGAAVWAAGYVLLPAGGLYRPIWKYDAKTLASDLSAHLAYGAGTGAAFWVLARI
jgi:hypothetical protein